MKVTRRGFLAIVGAAGATGVVAVAGFQALPGEARPNGEPEVRYGKESCARCSMVISDPRFAAAWREPDGHEKHFDDIGCMALDETDRHPPRGTRMWVHDYETEQWLGATDAYYVRSDTFKTPMSYGIAGAATPTAAERLGADRGGARVLQWPAVAPSLVRRN